MCLTLYFFALNEDDGQEKSSIIIFYRDAFCSRGGKFYVKPLVASFYNFDNFISHTMLSFSNIELKTNSKRFTKQARKFIRISVSKVFLISENSISSSKQPNQFVNEASIKWTTPISLPIVYAEEIDF